MLDDRYERQRQQLGELELEVETEDGDRLLLSVESDAGRPSLLVVVNRGPEARTATLDLSQALRISEWLRETFGETTR